MDTKYDVALSFAGMNRDYVGMVADQLKGYGVSFFYDNDEQVALWGTHLTEEFTRIYGRDSRYVVMFISQHYLKSMWTRLERRAALARALELGDEYILPARFDNSEVPGLPHAVHYLNLLKISPAELAVKICEKVGKPVHALPGNAVASPRSPSLTGEARFNYSDHDGRFRIGHGNLEFETSWSKSGSASIYCCARHNVRSVALAPVGARISQLTAAGQLNVTSWVRSVRLNQIVVLRNHKGFHAALKVLHIADDSRGASADELAFRYWILPDGSDNFSACEDPE